MSTVIVTYRAPAEDSPVVDTRGVRFIDRQPLELDAIDHAALIAKARKNPLFEVISDDEPEGEKVESPEPAGDGEPDETED